MQLPSYTNGSCNVTAEGRHKQNLRDNKVSAPYLRIRYVHKEFLTHAQECKRLTTGFQNYEKKISDYDL